MSEQLEHKIRELGDMWGEVFQKSQDNLKSITQSSVKILKIAREEHDWDAVADLIDSLQRVSDTITVHEFIHDEKIRPDK
jgi:hypothetical protein